MASGNRAARGPLDVPALKRILDRWQRALDGRGWNALYLENTELPRVVSRWGDPTRHRRASATAFATACFLQQGTPFLYQGQELGLANPRFASLDDFRDVCAHQRIAELRAAGWGDGEILAELQRSGRDNARAPMPWDDGPHGGFSAATPWLWPTPADPLVNVEREQADPNSTLHYFRQLLALRRAEPLLIHGGYTPLLARNQRIMAFTRDDPAGRIAVLCNLTPRPARYRHGGFTLRHPQLLLANHPVAAHPPLQALTLAPFEARVYRVE